MEGGGGKALSPDQIKNLLSTTRAAKGLSTEPRDIAVWYKQNHMLRDGGCSNPNCVDPRPHSDQGRNVVIELNGEFMCRFCFLDGWLSPNETT